VRVTYFRILLVLHVAGAIVGLGPSVTFGIIGRMAEEPGVGQPTKLALYDVLAKVNRFLVNPAAFILQPLTGVLLIFETGRNRDFFSHEWLWMPSFSTPLSWSWRPQGDRSSFLRAYGMVREGRHDTPEYRQAIRPGAVAGPIEGVFLLAILFLMVWKPGG
jgi:uncharacterized membrane protein